MLQLKQLKKDFPSGFTLGPIDWSLGPGTCVALFGQNGAGKSTLFQLISGNMDRSSGEALWCEEKISPDAYALKRRFGYLPQESHLPAWVHAEELLLWAAKLYGVDKSRVEDMIRRWDISKWRRRPLSLCSHGMQKRVGLALAFLHDPEFLILDEAFNALDIYHTRTLEELIAERSKPSRTTIISTHIPEIAAKLCSEAVMLKGGRMESLSLWENASSEERLKLIDKYFFGNP